MIHNFFTRRTVYGMFGLVAVFLLGARGYTLYAKHPQYETVEVKKTVITQKVTASGEIKSEDEVELKFPMSGKLAYLAVKKNDPVGKRGYIGSLDKEELQKKLTKALRDYSKERNDFEEERRITYKGTQDPEEALTDTAKRILEKNQWDLDKAVLDVELTDVAKRNADLYSPIAGVVTKVHTHEGTTGVAGTTPIVTIANPQNLAFIAKIGEADIANIAIGQEAVVTLDAFENKEFKGRVTEIDYAATTSANGGGKTYQVKIVLEDEDKVKLDMSGDVEITTVVHPDALGVQKMVIQEKDGATYVEVLEGKNRKEKEITTGIKGTGGVIEILSGVREGDTIIIPKPKD